MRVKKVEREMVVMNADGMEIYKPYTIEIKKGTRKIIQKHADGSIWLAVGYDMATGMNATYKKTKGLKHAHPMRVADNADMRAYINK